MSFRVLLVKTSSIGDVIHTLPVAETLKRTYPSIHLTWIIERKALDILVGNPYVDELMIVDFQRWKRSLHHAGSWEGLGRFVKRLRTYRFHIAIDVQGLLRSGLITFFSGAPIRIGFQREVLREKVNVLFTNIQARRLRPGSHIVDQNLALLIPLGIQRAERSFYFWIPPEVRQEVDFYLFENRNTKGTVRVAMNACGGWETKRWSLERYAALGDRIVRQLNADLYLLWGPGEQELAEGIQSLMREKAYCIPRMNLKQLAALLQRCHVFIGGDSGPLHLASALGIPVLGIYGPSDPHRNGPFHSRSRVVCYDGPCRPCYKRRCTSRECMERLSMEEVWQALIQLCNEMDDNTMTSSLRNEYVSGTEVY